MKDSRAQIVQTTIAIDKANRADLDNFHSDDNQHAVSFLREFLSDNLSGASCYIWGGRGSGKSHLLYAACKAVPSSVYIPVFDLQLHSDCLEGLEEHRLICVDDIHSVAGQNEWEEGLLNLLESVQSNRNLVIMTGGSAPDEAGFELADLVNRLQGRQEIRLSAATDATKLKILMDKAAERGLPIEPTVVQYVLRRYSRDMHALVRMLDHIAQYSLESRRKVTIPLLRELEEFRD